jgi:hypothetical protein
MLAVTAPAAARNDLLVDTFSSYVVAGRAIDTSPRGRTAPPV